MTDRKVVSLLDRMVEMETNNHMSMLEWADRDSAFRRKLILALETRINLKLHQLGDSVLLEWAKARELCDLPIERFNDSES
ncbi:MAG: hypothetical protein CFE50_17385 [Pseudomonas sp. PGPPP4]|nr:MAG: hypothetical protein CFE50_17385 [Pseudomonas sp. PGPPP4]